MRKRYVMLAIVLAGIGYAASQQPNETAIAQMRAEVAATDGHYAAKQAVKAMLRDPDSARFERMLTVRGTICGYVNARNSFGGYAGTREFMANGGLAILNNGSDHFRRDWNKRCTAKV